jgi:hypothetical protein
MRQPRHELLGVLEAHGADIEAVEDWRLSSALVMGLCAVVFGCAGSMAGGGIGAVGGARGVLGTEGCGVAEELLSVVGGVPGSEADVAEDDLVYISVGTLRGFLGGLGVVLLA